MAHKSYRQTRIKIKPIEPEHEILFGSNRSAYTKPYYLGVEGEITFSIEEFFAMQEQFLERLKITKKIPAEITFKSTLNEI